MSQRLKLIVAYDGGPFSGWQSQPGGKGIQDHLERAFERIAGNRVRVHGAGRTDAGVHALAQCAHVDLGNKRLSPKRWTAALNGVLAPAIRVLRCRWVGADFHARFSATRKIYRYRIYTGPVLPPFEHGRAWHLRGAIDLDHVKSAAKLFVGSHNFAGFAANRGRADTDTVRRLYSVKVRHAGALVELEFDGNGFLYKMVRLMVGALAQRGLGKISREEITERLANRTDFRTRLAAPAAGLFLVRVRY